MIKNRVFLVEETRSVTFTHRIRAKTEREAIEKIQSGEHGLELPLEDSDVEYFAEKEKRGYRFYDRKQPESEDGT